MIYHDPFRHQATDEDIPGSFSFGLEYFPQLVFTEIRFQYISFDRLIQICQQCRDSRKGADVDGAAIHKQTERIRTSLDRVKTINRKVTDVRTSANDIQTEVEPLRDEIRTSLTLSKTPSRLKRRTLADISRLRLCLVNRYIQSLSRVCIVWIESQHFAEFHNSISPAAEPA